MCVPSRAVDGRQSLLAINLKEVSLDSNCNFDEVAKLTEGYSGADITSLCRFVVCMHITYYTLCVIVYVHSGVGVRMCGVYMCVLSIELLQTSILHLMA